MHSEDNPLERGQAGSAYIYFRDRDGTLCRDHPQGQHEVWLPNSETWSAYFWDARDVVAITPEEAAAGWGAAAVGSAASVPVGDEMQDGDR